MKILFLQDHMDAGGAARAAGRYAVALEREGHHVILAAGDRQRGSEDFIVSGKPPRGWKRILEYIMPPKYRAHRRVLRARRSWRRVLQKCAPDMVWIHNIHGAFKWGWGAELVEEACRHGQVLWTLHDMWPLGSGHYYFPEEQLPFEYSQSLLGKLAEEVAGKRLILTTPSIWLKQLIESQCGNYTSLRMPYFLDTDVFQPAYREQMRRHLGLKKYDFLFLSAAEDLNDPRKGISLLCEAWKKMGDWIAKNNVSLGLLGRNGHHFECPSSRIFSYGNQQNEADVASYMAASDLFIHPSSADNFPLVLEESQACGTPVMAFQVGGVSEAFENNETGFLIKSRDTKSLMDSIIDVVQNREMLLKMRTRSRENIILKHKKSAFSDQWQEALKKIKEKDIIK